MEVTAVVAESFLGLHGIDDRRRCTFGQGIIS